MRRHVSVFTLGITMNLLVAMFAPIANVETIYLTDYATDFPVYDFNITAYMQNGAYEGVRQPRFG